MIVRDPAEFGRARQSIGAGAARPALPGSVFLVRPAGFQVNAEPSRDNPYMDLATPADPERAISQSRNLEQVLRRCGIAVKVFEGDPEATDGVFPNNVFATVPGKLIIGSMLYPSRQVEAERTDIRTWFAGQGYSVEDLSARDCVAELTGPMIIDRARGIGFCGMSDRVDEAGLRAMHGAFGLQLTFAFGLVPGEYHTNVVMSILAGRACVLCPESFADPAVPEAIAQAFPGRTLFLTEAEKNAFAANCIALSDQDLFMSRAGADALRTSSRAVLQDWGFRLHTAELDEIEKAGGSLRCMIAEVF